MRACYFIQSHRNPVQIARLVRAIQRSSPASIVLIGHDFTRCHLELRSLAGLGEVHLLAQQEPARRGEFSTLAPYLQGIDWLLERDIPFEWLIYISGQDYPVRPPAEYERLLAGSHQDGFLRHWDIFGTDGPWAGSKRGHRRYSFRYLAVPPYAEGLVRGLRPINNLQSLVHIYTAYGAKIGLRRFRTPFHEGFRCYAGIQWHTLSRRCVEYLHKKLGECPDLVAWYRRTIVPDESVVQTVLANAGRFRLAQEDHRYVDHPGSRDGHPRTLATADLSAITRDGIYFARKFDEEVDRAVLDALDRRIAP